MQLAIENRSTGKRSGRRPLEDGKRRVQFGTRIAPETLRGLEDLAKSSNNNLGRVIDFLVGKELTLQSVEKVSS